MSLVAVIIFCATISIAYGYGYRDGRITERWHQLEQRLEALAKGDSHDALENPQGFRSETPGAQPESGEGAEG